MQSYPLNAPLAGRFTTPHEAMADWGELVGAIHDLDADNVAAGLLTADKAEVGAWGDVLPLTRSTMQTVNLTEMTGRQNAHAIPDDANVPWVSSFATGDGVFAGDLVITHSSYGVWVGVKIDGILVGVSPADAQFGVLNPKALSFATPLGARTHLLEFVFGVNRALAAGTTAINFHSGVFFGRMVSR